MKENIKMEKEMEKEKNIIKMVNYYLKVNIYMIENGQVKDMMIVIILFMN